jgi:hypothetical protein
MAKKDDEILDMITKDHEKLLKQKLKALGIDEKSIKSGESEPTEFIPTGVFEVD